MRAVRVTTMAAEATRIEETEWAVGVIESRRSPRIAAEVAGQVRRLHVDEGQRVRAGQLLAEIDDAQYRYERTAQQAEVGRLEAQIRNRELDLGRARRLVDERLVAAEQVDGLEAELDALREQLRGAEARVADSERRLARTRVQSPVDAEVAARLIDEGDFVSTGTVAFDLVDVDNLRIRLPFPEYLATELRAGLPVRLTSAAAGEAEVEATITEVRPGIDPASRSLVVIVDFANPGGWRPGASVRAEVVLSVREQAVTVPQVAVVRRPAGEVVYVVNEGRAEERLVRRGLRSGRMVEILEGLSPGDTVIVDGAGFLTQGTPVDVAGS
ncbi:MAG: efflux RND transporter periplasmic adaptor subunit [Chromatiales bacterium]|nr:efflux RND transporter periplasmic adaptor subunit [Chromatiales bacterium]